MTRTISTSNRTLKGFQADVDSALSSLCGVGYSSLLEISQTLDPNGRLLKAALRHDASPERFAKTFQKFHGFACIEPGKEPTAFSVANRYKAAVIDFATGQPRWHAGVDGNAYQLIDDGRIFKLSVVERNSAHLFGVSESTGNAQLLCSQGDPLGRVSPPDCSFRLIAASDDVGPAITRAAAIVEQDRIAERALSETAKPVENEAPEEEIVSSLRR